MKDLLTTSIVKMASLFTLLEKRGLDPKIILEKEGIDPAILDSPDSRFTIDQMHRLTERARELSGDEFIGLHQGESFIRMSNILGHLMMNCTNLREALNKYGRYQKIADETVRSDLTIAKDRASLIINALDSNYNDAMQMMDFRLSGCYTFFKVLTEADIPLIEVSFRHDTPEETGEYERIFKCPIKFSSDVNALVFKKDFLDHKIIQPNRELFNLFEEHAKSVLDKQISIESYKHKVGRIIIKSFSGENPSIEDVASSMAMSVRKLQNKLNEENTTYSELYNSIRKERAMEYLKDKKTSIAEITYMLGFSEPSAFHRSFKRWTGHAPGFYRNNLMDGAL